MNNVNIVEDFAHPITDKQITDRRCPDYLTTLADAFDSLLLHYLPFTVAAAAVSVTPHRLIRIISCILILASSAKIMRRRTWSEC